MVSASIKNKKHFPTKIIIFFSSFLNMKRFNFYSIIRRQYLWAVWMSYIYYYIDFVLFIYNYNYFFFPGDPQDQRPSYGFKVEQESFESHKHA